MTDQEPVSLLQQALAEERARSKQLEEANRALVQEFSKADSYEDTIKIARDAIKNILPLAISTTESLIACAESESVRASLSRWVMDAVLTGKLDQSSDHSVANLLRKLAENDSTFEGKVKAIARDQNDHNNDEQ